MKTFSQSDIYYATEFVDTNDNRKYLVHKANAIEGELMFVLVEDAEYLKARIKELEEDLVEARGVSAGLSLRIKDLENIIKVDDAIRITSLENENEHLKERNRELEALAAKHECGPCKHCTPIPGQEALAKDEYNTLYLDNDVLRFSSREGEDDYVLETRINFCPICGMELEHED